MMPGQAPTAMMTRVLAWLDVNTGNHEVVVLFMPHPEGCRIVFHRTAIDHIHIAREVVPDNIDDIALYNACHRMWRGIRRTCLSVSLGLLDEEAA